MTLFAHGPATEKDGNRAKCRKCGHWYESTLKVRYPPKELEGEVIWRPAPYIARSFDPGHENPVQTTAKELCPDGTTEKEFEPDHEGNPQAGGKFCDPEE